jgi:hypothetical protein
MLEHRHVGLLVFAGTEPRILRRWLARLARRSARGHLVVHLDRVEMPVRQPPGADRARERMPAWGDGAEALPRVSDREDDRLTRAIAFDRRGRHASAERWYRSAMESARRRGDDPGRAAACRGLVERLSCRGQWDAASRAARYTLESLDEPAAQTDLVASLAGVLIARAELSQAEALLSAWAAALAADGTPGPAAIRFALAGLRFWQGRLDECASILDALPWHTSRVALAALIAWVRRDAAALTHVIAVARVEPPCRPVWLRLVLSRWSADPRSWPSCHRHCPAVWTRQFRRPDAHPHCRRG